MHRRKLSKEEKDYEVVDVDVPTVTASANPPSPTSQSPKVNGDGDHHGRPRVNSSPSQPIQPQMYSLPPSAGPYRTTFGAPSSPNGLGPTSPFRTTFSHSHSHSRTRSISSGLPVSRSLSSPLSGTFPARSVSMNEPPSFPIPSSSSVPSLDVEKPPSPQHTRRHSRIHSRNLSVFFPRPGARPHAAIAEDGSQELDYNGPIDEEAPVSIIPAAGSSMRLQAPPGSRKLGEGFTFGGRPSSTSPGPGEDNSSMQSSRAARRGHHHKHSMSHNFFSFLEPGSQVQTQASQPASPWNPITPIPDSALSIQAQNGGISPLPEHDPPSIPKETLGVAVVQFLLGASLWVSGQQSGSLGCTGLGYWVVFDAFGVALGHVLPAYLSLDSLRSDTRRPYGNARIETLALFAQSVYLIFSSVYVCKETVEHFLLSAGEGHHHHRGDEDLDIIGIQFPTFLIFITLISLISTSLFYSNHTKLVEAAIHRLPSFTSFFRSSRSWNTYSHTTPSSPVAIVLSNPFTTAPLLFSFLLLLAAIFLPASQHRPFDLLLASIETVLTFSIAYPASVVLGTVLLQTSPERGMPGGHMEAFLRAMREIERHPHVLHLPAPHIWQLTPTILSHTATSSGAPSKDSLVVTLELHVRRDLDDADVLNLTRWAHDRCRGALSLGMRRRVEDGETEVTVGIVKG